MSCNYKDYPLDWKTVIRPAILERDVHKCKFCGVGNYAIGYRDAKGKFYDFKTIDDVLNNTGYDYFENELSNCFDKEGDPKKPIKIVLTIMHLDHNTQHNEYDNLAAGCQRCHNIYDLEYRKKNTRETINKKKKLQKLF